MFEAQTVSLPRVERRVPVPVHLPSLVAPTGARVIGPYELIATLGEGGMGNVCIARRSGPGGFHRYVALKRIHGHIASEREAVSMFLDEARLAATVSHRNVTQIYELGEIAETYFLVMELVDGVTLSAMMRLGPVPLAFALYVVAEAARGLHAAHEARDRGGQRLHLVHRDVSPSNILVGFDGGVKVSDFGVAKAEGRLTRTDTGHLRGKTSYMAPEQALGDDVDRRADVFALGVVLHELTVGVRPFGKGTSAEVLLRVVSNDRQPLRDLATGLSEPVVEIIERCLAPDRAARFPTADALADALDAVRRSEAPCSAAEVALRMESLLGVDRQARRAQLAALEFAFDSPAEVPALPAAPAQTVSPRTPGSELRVAPSAREGVRAPFALGIALLFTLLGAGALAVPLLANWNAPDGPGPSLQPEPRPAPSVSTLEPSADTRAASVDTRERSQTAATPPSATPVQNPEPASEPTAVAPQDPVAPAPRSPATPRAERAVRTHTTEPSIGTLNARCASPAEVWLDGDLVGETFLSLDVPTGRHRLVLRQDGLEDRRVITIRSGVVTGVGDCFAER